MGTLGIKHLALGMLRTNCYIVYSEGKCAVIDPGAQADKIVSAISEIGAEPQYILLTHPHFDHIGAVKELCATYPNIKVCIGEGDLPELENAAESFAAAVKGNREKYTDFTADILLNDGDSIAVGAETFTVISTPGHTRAGVCYLCGDELFTGDTLFREEVGRCDLVGGDYHTILRSVKRLAAMSGEYNVYPGHEEFSTMSHERAFNRYINSTEV